MKADVVLVHPHWHTVHELGPDGKPRCGNGRGERTLDQITYLSMNRRNVDADWPLCQLGGCAVARESQA